MRASHVLAGLLAIAAAFLVAVALLGGSSARRASAAAPYQQPALRPTGDPTSTATARRAAPTAPVATQLPTSSGVPVVGADPVAANDPPAQAADPIAVAGPIDVPQAAAPMPAMSALGDGWGPRPAPDLDPRPFAEAHWQGLESIPRTKALVESLKLPPDVEGVILDDVTLPADLEGFRAGDLVTAVNGVPTPDLMSLVRAADQVREDKRVMLDIVRSGVAQRLELVALFDRLGTANAETPAMIPPGARSPHPYQGPCLSCHRIGTTGSLAADQGDPLPGPPPPIRPNRNRPHRDRGPCTSCHRILP